MSKFKENDRVELISAERKGKIDKVFPFDDETIYIVRLDSGECVKCFAEDIKLVEEKTEESTDVIVIDRKEFNKVVAETISSLAKESKDPSFSVALGLSGVVFGMRLEKKLFERKND